MRFTTLLLPLAAALVLIGGCKDSSDAGMGRSGIDQPFPRAGSGSAATDSTGSVATPLGARATGATKSVTGTLAQAGTDEVRLDTESHPGMPLKINDSTKITLDGKDATVAQLQEGAQIRASYSGSGDTATAIRIEAKSAPAVGSKDPAGTPAAGSKDSTGTEATPKTVP